MLEKGRVGLNGEYMTILISGREVKKVFFEWKGGESVKGKRGDRRVENGSRMGS